MVLIIQKDNNQIIYDPNVIIFRSICDVKTYVNDSYTIVLIDININDEGIVEGYNFPFEELLISLNVVAVISNKKSKKLQEICNYYKIKLLINNY